MNKYAIIFVLTIVSCFGALAPAFAAPSAQGKDLPLDISAQESLEWYEDKGLYVARGEARVVRGKTILEADLLTAHRRKDAANGKQSTSSNLSLITAEGNVYIHDDKQQVFGQHALYDLDKKTFKLTGNNLKFMAAEDVVTARDSLEYHEDKNVAIARGRALALHEGSRIEADILSATFVNGLTGQKEMKKMMAQGRVVIVLKDGNVSRSNRAVYDVKRDVAVLLGNVRIKQGETLLAGDEAEVDFKTGKSRLLNTGTGRVRALLSSSSGKKKEVTP